MVKIHEAGGEQGEKGQVETREGGRKESETIVVMKNPELTIRLLLCSKPQVCTPLRPAPSLKLGKLDAHYSHLVFPPAFPACISFPGFGIFYVPGKPGW